MKGIAGACSTLPRAWGNSECARVVAFFGEIVASTGARRGGRCQKRAALREKVSQIIPFMFPLYVRWQVIRNRKRGPRWDSMVMHADCSLAEAQEWWVNFQHHGSPWGDDSIQNRHADAARFNAPFLRDLDGLIREHL